MVTSCKSNETVNVGLTLFVFYNKKKRFLSNFLQENSNYQANLLSNFARYTLFKFHELVPFHSILIHQFPLCVCFFHFLLFCRENGLTPFALIIFVSSTFFAEGALLKKTMKKPVSK